MIRWMLFFVLLLPLGSLLAQEGDTLRRPDPLQTTEGSSTVVVQPLEEKKKRRPKATEAIEAPASKEKSLLLLEGSLEEQLSFYQKSTAPPAEARPHPQNWQQCQFDPQKNNPENRQLLWRPFFNFTPKQYRDYFKNSPFLRCEGALSEETGELYLNLRIYIGTPLGAKAYGALQPNSALYLKQLNGTNIILRTPGGASGQTLKEETLYEVRYRLERSDVKALQESELDRVRLDWSVGYEAYEVYYVDFLWDQFACFE